MSPSDTLFESKEKSSQNGRIHTQLKVIECILNLPDDIPSVIDLDNLTILNAYRYRSSHCKGRLYGYHNTMTLISSQCRYYLFKGQYFDIDLKNTYPTMLLSYTTTHNLEAPVLEKYISNRKEFLAKITKNSGIERNKAKIQVLKAINLITDETLPEDLKPLHRDILFIRNHLYENHVNTLTELGQYCLTRESFIRRNLEERKLSLQFHWCTTEESKSLEILREVCLHKRKLERKTLLNKKLGIFHLFLFLMVFM